MTQDLDVSNLNLSDQNQKPFGLTLGQWTVRWWEWLLSSSKDVNPALDDDGSHGGVNQSGPVWFLAGTFGENRFPRRNCTLPRDKHILFPVINYEMNVVEKFNLQSDTDLIKNVVDDMDDIVHLEASVDGQSVPIFRVQSDPKTFFINFPPNNCMGIKAGRIKCAADGYWVFLQPLSQGKHTIYFHGACSGGIRNSTAQYNLTVI